MGSRLIALASCLAALLCVAPPAPAAGRDDTARLQAALDAGGTVSLPRLPNGECYATRGLWVSHDGTTITSDGACIVSLGPGEARFKGGDGRPVHANAVFFLNHSTPFGPLPVRVSISGLDIRVPVSQRMLGVSAFGGGVTLSHVSIKGGPLTDVLIGGGSLASAGMTPHVAVLDSTLTGGAHDVIKVFGPIDLRVEGSTLAGARGTRKTDAAAGVHLVVAERGQPAANVRIAGNTIVDNAGPGLFFDLDPKDGLPVLASGFDVTGNNILRNARTAPVARRAGIVIAGGQRGRPGVLTLTQNVVRLNRGPGLLGRKVALAIAANANDLSGNRGGASKGLHLAAAAPADRARSFTRISTAGAGRDDTASLQARLDAGGGTIFLPKLPNGECYATRGLWVSRDDTTITSDGACIVSLGPGEVRLHSTDGDPIPSGAVFFVNRSRPKGPAPVGVTISNLSIVVPDGEPMYGVSVAGHDVTLRNLDISGSPKDDVLLGGRGNGNGFAAFVSVLDSTLRGAQRNAISANGVIGLRIEGNTIEGVRDSPPGQPGAGVDLEPDDRGQPAWQVQIRGNRIQDNAGPGILFELETNGGNAVLATDLEISGNTIVRNSNRFTPPKRAGVVLAGGQDGVNGSLLLHGNTIRDNGGPGILESRLRLDVDASGNDVAGNSG
jgi:hypothetical protein